MAESDGANFLSWENLIYIADFLEVSQERNVSLLGGEPALHHHFVDFVLYLVDRNFHVTIFTSGIFPEKTLDCARKEFLSIRDERISFVCNINHPSICSSEELYWLNKFLENFGPITSAGFNIYKPDFSLEFLFPLILKYGLKKTIRLGLAHPIPGARNLFVSPEDMISMGRCLAMHLPQFERFGVVPGFDCGFPLCIFPDDTLGALYKVSNGKINFGCGVAIDIGLDMSVWGCFPFSEQPVKSLYDFDSITDIQKFFKEFQAKLRVESGGIFDECDECGYRESGLCAGGCSAHIASRFKREPHIRFSEFYR